MTAFRLFRRIGGQISIIVPVAHPRDIFELGTEMNTKSAASATSFGEASGCSRPGS